MSALQLFFLLFLIVVVGGLIVASIYISLPSKVLGDIEDRIRKNEKSSDKKTNTSPE